MSATALKDKLEVSQEEIDLSKVVANSAQSRAYGGVAWRLKAAGYGLFEKISLEGKEPIWPMLFSESAADRKTACQLVEDYEPDIASLAFKLDSVGQLQSIGVFEESGEYDVLYGMRRAFAKAYLSAKSPKGGEATIEAKVYSGKMTDADKKLMALSENDDREDESPIDKAITWNSIMEQKGWKPKDLGEQIGVSDQTVRNYVKLLHKKIEDLQPKVHSGEMAVERALTVLSKRLDKGGDDADRTPADKGTRYRMPGIKGLVKLYRAKEKPKNMEKKEWEMWIAPDVRRLLAYKTGEKFSEWTPPEPEAEAPATNGEAPAAPKKVLAVFKERAVKLLISLGKTAARTWDDEKIKDALENIPNTAPADAVVEDKSLQTLLDTLRKNFAEGIGVKIKADPKK